MYLLSNVKYYVHKRKYKECLEEIEYYLKDENNGIFDELIYYYIICLINLEKDDEAKKCIEKYVKMFPGMYLVNSMELCLKGKYIDLFNKYLNDNYFTGLALLKLISTCMLYEQYDIAKNLIEKGLKDKNNDEYKDFLERNLFRLKNHDEKGAFIKTDYQYFKKNYRSVELGDIVFLHLYCDQKKENVFVNEKSPFVVWKIIENRIYVFPLTKAKNGDYREENYIYKKENYLEFDNDRLPKPIILKVKDNAIDYIIGKINNYDLIRSFTYIYKNILRDKEKEITDVIRIFLDEVLNQMKISKNDILVFYDREKNIRSDYFVLDIKYNNYEVVKLEYDNGIYNVIGKKILIPMENYPLYCKKIDSIQLTNIFDQLSITGTRKVKKQTNA